MSAVLLDTHAWIQSLMAPARLGSRAKEAITGVDAVFVSRNSVYEVMRKAHLGEWPEIVPHIGDLGAEGQTISATLTRAVAARAGVIDWRHRDPFDRLIAATAIELGHPLVSKDEDFDALVGTPGWIRRIW